MDKLCAFKLFGIGHFVYILLAAGIVVGCVFALKRLGDKGRLITNIALFGGVFFFILLEFIGRIILIEDYNFFENLPVDYLSIFAVVMLIGFIRQNSKWIKLSYLVVLPISIFSLIFIPKLYCEYSTFSISLISYVFAHTAMITLSLLNILGEEIYLNKKDVFDSNMTFMIASASMHIINVILRFSFIGPFANLGGTMGEGYNHCIELLSTIIPVPFVFMLPLFAIMIGISFLIYLPFDILQSRKQRQGEIEELIALGNLKKQQEMRMKYNKNKSQIYINSSEKAKPENDKGVTNKTKTDFVVQNKEIQVNNERKEG